MFDHVGIKVHDLGASAAFYAAALAPLGYAQGYEDQTMVCLGPKEGPAFWLYRSVRPAGSGSHVAFRADNRGAVDQFYSAALKAGATDNGPPGLRPDYGPTYYAAFVVDLDGNNIEAMLT